MSTLPPVAQFRKLSEGTAEDYKLTQAHFAQVASIDNRVDIILNMVKGLKGQYADDFKVRVDNIDNFKVQCNT